MIVAPIDVDNDSFGNCPSCKSPELRIGYSPPPADRVWGVPPSTIALTSSDLQEQSEPLPSALGSRAERYPARAACAENITKTSMKPIAKPMECGSLFPTERL